MIYLLQDCYQGNKEVSGMIYFKVKNSDFRKYYIFYGTSGCSAKKYQKENLELGMINESKESKLSAAIHNRFKTGDRFTKKDIKQIL